MTLDKVNFGNILIPHPPKTSDDIMDTLLATLLSGGEDGGRIVACGTPEEIRRCKGSVTGRFI